LEELSTALTKMSWLVWEMTKPLQGVMVCLWGVLSFSMVLWRKPHGLWWTLTGNDWWVDDLVGWSLMKILFRGLTALKSKYIKETAIRLMDVGGSRVPRRKPIKSGEKTRYQKKNEVFSHQNHVMWATQPWSTIWKFGHGLDHPSKWWQHLGMVYAFGEIPHLDVAQGHRHHRPSRDNICYPLVI